MLSTKNPENPVVEEIAFKKCSAGWYHSMALDGKYYDYNYYYYYYHYYYYYYYYYSLTVL